jgi:hypothetical protein
MIVGRVFELVPNQSDDWFESFVYNEFLEVVVGEEVSKR